MDDAKMRERVEIGWERFSNEILALLDTITTLTAEKAELEQAWLNAEAKIEEQKAALSAANARLAQASAWFEEYGDLHRQKSPPDIAKAQRNYERASYLRHGCAALASKGEEPR